jgi:2-keto-3-deoxy-L-rhamnonate aldolase RhmA
MSQASLRKRLAAGERAFGTMVFEFFTPGLIPVLHAAGCEWVVLDMEHSGASIDTIKQQIACARGLDIAVWVRVPEKSYAAVATVLDAGARGIMVPMLETVEQAQDLVRWARYRPEGLRGCAFGVAHDGYGATDPTTIMRDANDQIVLIALIETVQAIENCEEIMAVPGLDVGWLGHYDLTNDMGITAQFDDPHFVASAERLAKACAASGKTAGTLDANPAYVRAQMARGYRLVGYGTDVVAMRSALQQGFAALREDA